MNAIILCGGLSTRLGEITKSVPKILLEIKGKTVLEWQIEKLRRIGIVEVVMAAGHLSEVLFKEVGLECNGVGLKYAIEQERLGTGGAIKHALEYVDFPDEPTLILNGDILASVNLAEMRKALNPESDGIILGAKVEDASSYGTLIFDEKKHLLEFREKEGLHQSGYINGGFYLFNPRAQKYFPNQRAFSIEYEVFPKMNDLYVYTSNEPWIDIGVPERLAWARENWKE